MHTKVCSQIPISFFQISLDVSELTGLFNRYPGQGITIPLYISQCSVLIPMSNILIQTLCVQLDMYNYTFLSPFIRRYVREPIRKKGRIFKPQIIISSVRRSARIGVSSAKITFIYMQYYYYYYIVL